MNDMTFAARFGARFDARFDALALEVLEGVRTAIDFQKQRDAMEIAEAIRKGNSQCEALCRHFPDRSASIRDQHGSNLNQLRRELFILVEGEDALEDLIYRREQDYD